MKKMLAALCLGSLVALVLTGCMASPTGIAPSTKPLTPGKYTVIGDARGRAIGVYLMGILPLSEPYPAKKSIERALESSGADALVEVTTDYWVLPIPFINITVTTTNGKAVTTR